MIALLYLLAGEACCAVWRWPRSLQFSRPCHLSNRRVQRPCHFPHQLLGLLLLVLILPQPQPQPQPQLQLQPQLHAHVMKVKVEGQISLDLRQGVCPSAT